MVTISQMVWRLEEKLTGHGPWSSGLGAGRPPVFDEPRPQEMPAPYEETGYDSFDSWEPPYARFAYPTLERLQQWWCVKALQYADELGFVLRVYAVVGSGRIYPNQVIYNAKEATLISTIPLTRLMGVVPPDVHALTCRAVSRSTTQLSAPHPRSTSYAPAF